MGVVLLFLLVTGAGLTGYALLARIGLEDGEAWAGGRLVGLVAVAMSGWWVGVLGLPWWRTAGAVVLVAGVVWGVVELWRRQPSFKELLVPELVFWGATLLVVVLRLHRPEILNQEKLMDMGILSMLLRADSFPPPDMWLAGETLPYYYWGSLLWSIPLTVSRVLPDIGYNLVAAMVGGLSAPIVWAIGRRVGGGRHASGLLASFFCIFAGTADGLRQVLASLDVNTIKNALVEFDFPALWRALAEADPQGLDLWHSSRQVPDTITEFPLFTLWHGDLHPHLLCLPIVCAAVLVAMHVGRTGVKVRSVAALTVLFGVTWAANPWAMPPTLVAVALAVICAGGRWWWPWLGGGMRWLAVVCVAVGGWLVTAPFHVNFNPPFEGIKPVAAQTTPVDLLLYGGVVLVPALWCGLVCLRRLLGPQGEQRSRALLLASCAGIMVVALASGRPTLVIVGAVMAALVAVVVISGEEMPERFGLALAALALFLLAVPEVVYVHDSYGQQLHRMNTVFKAYFQAWVFLAMALPVTVAGLARSSIVRKLALLAMVACALPHGLGLVLSSINRPVGLDGLAWMDASDRTLVEHLRGMDHGTTIIEAVGGAYTEYARLSAASGVPAYLGWANHELVWRGSGVAQETARRRRLVADVYGCGDAATVRRLVAESGVDCVAIGFLERRDFAEDTLKAVVEAGVVELDADGAQLVCFDSSREAQGE